MEDHKVNAGGTISSKKETKNEASNHMLASGSGTAGKRQRKPKSLKQRGIMQQTAELAEGDFLGYHVILYTSAICFVTSFVYAIY